MALLFITLLVLSLQFEFANNETHGEKDSHSKRTRKCDINKDVRKDFDKV